MFQRMSRRSLLFYHRCLGLSIILLLCAACGTAATPIPTLTPQPTATATPANVTITVNTLQDDPRGCPDNCPLRHAIEIANNGDEIVFSEGMEGLLRLVQPITLDKRLTITGASEQTAITGPNLENIFIIQADVTLNNLSLRGSDTALLLNSGSNTLNNVEITLTRIGIMHTGGSLTIDNSEFNRVNMSIWHSAGGALNITSTLFDGGGFGVYQSGRGALSISDSVFTGIGRDLPEAMASPGPIVTQSCPNEVITITRTVFRDNSASIYNVCDMTVTDSTFEGNQDRVFSNVNSLTISGSTFVDNVVENTDDGGAAVFHQGNDLSILNSTFINNQADTNGGAIFLQSGAGVTISFSTITGNRSGTSGGGVYIEEAFGGDSSPTFVGNIIYNNSAPSGADVFGQVNSLTYNLIGRESGSNGWFASDLTGVNPMLGELGDNGGFTQTIALLEGSPALGAAASDCPATDQRGEPRQAPCDIGAFEASD